MSMWLSGANSVANTARGRIAAEAKRQSTAAITNARATFGAGRDSRRRDSAAKEAPPALRRGGRSRGRVAWPRLFIATSRLSASACAPGRGLDRSDQAALAKQGARRTGRLDSRRGHGPTGPGATGSIARRVKSGERLPLMVMLHGCGQDANSFATSTRMNRIAMRERFLVLYPEQDRLANPQGCWNWFDTSSGRAHGEAALIMQAIDQVCLLHPVDRTRVPIAGLSAGRQHGGAAGHAAPRSLQGRGDALGHPAGHRAFHAVGHGRDARPARHAAAGGRRRARWRRPGRRCW